MSHLKLYLFGAPRIVLNGSSADIPRRKVMALLTYLAVTRQPQRRDSLGGLLWPESDQKAARASLRRELHGLNQVIGDEWLTTTRETIGLNPDADVWIDTEEFRSLVAMIKDAAFDATLMKAEDLKDLTQAAKLHQGDFLAGFTLSDCPDFDDWQFFENDELRREFANTLEALVHSYESQADFNQAITYARRWLALDPMHEPVHRVLMRLFTLADQQAAAVRQYNECVRILDEELGVPPEEETVSLFEAIRARKVTGSQGGETAEVINRLVPESPTPPDAPSTPASSFYHNLPELSTSFVGRQNELDAIKALLVDEADCRMITLVGVGGIGKTRLALAVAERVMEHIVERKQHATEADGTAEEIPQAQFSDGIYFVPLANVQGGDSILTALADVFSFSYQNNTDPQTQLLHFLAPKRLLLILDSFDHVLEEADLLLEMLNSAPGLTLLITSRVSINLQEEWLYAIGGFPVPGAEEQLEQITANSAIQLFVQRARRADSSLVLTDELYQHIARICHLVDGLPLGIELAATWVRVLGIEEIAAEIESNLDFLATAKRNANDRHSSMRIVLEQTWELLSPPEQEAFRKLSVFHNGFTRQAATRVVDASMLVLAALVRKSIISHSRTGRYTIHGLLRQFAVTKLQEEVVQDHPNQEHPDQKQPVQERSVSEKHSRYFGTFLRTLEDDLSGTPDALALRQIGQDLDNIRQGWQWIMTQLADSLSDAKVANRYVDGLFHFYDTRSRFREGAREFQFAYDRLEHGTTQSVDAEIVLLRGRISARLGWFAFQIGQPEEAKTHLLYSLECHRKLDAQAEIIFSLNYLGAVYRHEGAYLDATEALEESQQLCRAQGDRFGLTVALNILGQIAYEQQNYDQAQIHLEESLSVKQAIGDRRGTTFSLLYLGLVATAQGDNAKAIPLFQESKLISEEYGDRRSIAIAQCNLADVEMAMNHPAKAQALYQDGLAIYDDIYNVLGMVTTYIKLGDLALAQEDPAVAAQQYSQAIRTAGELQVTNTAIEALIEQPRAWLLENGKADLPNLHAQSHPLIHS